MAFIPWIAATTIVTVIRDGIKSAFTFIASKSILLWATISVVQFVLSIGFLIFVRPDALIDFFVGLLNSFGIQPVDCSKLPPETCPLLNMAGVSDIFAMGLYWSIVFLMIWMFIKSLKMLVTNFFNLRNI